MNLSEQNEQAFRRKLDKQFVDQYEDLKMRRCERCFVAETVDHNEILCQQRDGYNWRLNSIYKPELAAEKYAESCGELHDYAVICIFGMSDGRVIRKLCEKCNGTQSILIYEPDCENFMMAMEHFRLDDIIEKEWVYLVVEEMNGDALHGILDALIYPANYSLVTECVLPNYSVLYPAQEQDYSGKMWLCVKKQFFNINTSVSDGNKMADCILYNLPCVLRGSSVNQLKNEMKKYNLTQIPAIIVGAGPSLDRNIRQLKEVGNRAFIIAVDSAWKALLREGIHYHIGVSVDFNKNPELFDDEQFGGYPLVLTANVLPLAAEKSRSRLFFESSAGFEGFEEKLKEKVPEGIGGLRSGGSVSNDAFSLAEELGFTKIILVGQDLAYTDGKTHVSGFAESEANKRREETLTQVEGMDGSLLRTDLQMATYREWFETAIQRTEGEITVYNATEGGTRMHGAVELTLEEAVRELCREELDFSTILKNVPKLLSEQEQKEMRGVFYELDADFRRLKEQVAAGIDAYRTLVRLEEAGAQNSAAYRAAVKQIGLVNALEEQEPYMSFIECYVTRETYAVVQDIYVAEELTVKEIADRGIRLLKEYEKGIDIAIEQVQKILKPALEPCRKP